MTFTDTLSAIFTNNTRARRRIWSSRIFVGLEEGKLCMEMKP